jgi:SpoVK/Ycf46/Vps4 family AAA+-type ATPase
MTTRSIQVERAQNLWSSFLRSFDPVARCAQIIPDPNLDFGQIGGLAGPKDEILTYACAATSPEVYGHWGTQPPNALLLIGRPSTGKSLLVEALATQTQTSLVRVDVPRMALDIIHAGSKAGELATAWSGVLEEMPPLTILFDELEFSLTQEIGTRRGDLPIGPIMDFLLEIVDRSIASENHLVVGSTSHPDSLRPAFLTPNRFERIVEVIPVFPDDVIDALRIHVSAAEKRAQRPLFEDVDWRAVVDQNREAAIGDWIRLLHAVLRRKARCEAAGEEVTAVTIRDLSEETNRFKQAQRRIRPSNGGNYV